MIAFIIPGLPIAQPRQRSAVIAGHMRNYTPAKHPVNAFKAACVLAAKQVYDGPPLEGPLCLSLTCVFPRPKALVWKSKPMPRTWHTKKPDADNVAKAVKDALSKIIWRDDCQVVEMHVSKWIASGEEAPHVAVEVEDV